MIYVLFLLIITTLLYFGFGFISALSENDLNLKEDLQEEKRSLVLHKLYQNRQIYFYATYLITTLINVLVSIAIYKIFIALLGYKSMIYVFTVLVFVPIVAICILLPEKLGRLYSLKSYKNSMKKEEEIMSMVNEGHQMGEIESSEAQMISNIFEFGDKEAKDIMINRSHMLALDCTTTLDEAIDFMLGNRYSRYPVYEENIDRIIGMLYLKDALRFRSRENLLNKQLKSLKKLLRKPFYITETKKIDDIFKSMQSQKVQLAIIIDEYGQTSGILSMEDILEEIVGNILDEYDEDEHYIQEKSETEFIIDGLTKLEDVEELLGITFDSHCETLNGFMISNLEHIPANNEKFSYEYQEFLFSILKSDGRMVTSVLVEKIIKEIDNEDEKTTIEDESK